METNQTAQALPDDLVAFMYAPPALMAGGTLLFMGGWDSGIIAIVGFGAMTLVTGLVLTLPMAPIALYNAIKVDSRPVIWGSALLNVLALAITVVVIARG